jgi:hypothetical protein
MLYRAWILSALLLLLLAGCATEGPSSNGGSEPVDSSGDTETEAWATRMYGDARVFYYVKPGAQGVTDKTQPQKELRYTLINKTHSLYRGLPDNQLKPEEYYISNADMMDVLNGLRKKCAFFELSREIGSRDPFAVAKAQSYTQTERFIAVEIIKDGVVNCAYFPRQPITDAILASLNDDQKAYLRHFTDAQNIIVFYTRYALPRGTSSTGNGPSMRRNPR